MYALNRAVELNSGSSHQQILYDAQGAKLAYMSAQTVQKYMLPLANGVQAVFNSSGISYYRHADWLGSSRLALYTTGAVYADQAYAPFGETYAETSTTDRSFTGQTQDTTAGSQGVYDFLLRQQASNQGRWLVPDPAGLAAVDITNPQTWNRYAYVGNNPLSNVDALGLFMSTAPPPPPPLVEPIDWGLFGFGGGGNGIDRFQLLPLDGPGEGRGGGAVVDPSQQPPDDPNRPTLRCGVSAASLDQYLKGKGSPMEGEGQNLMDTGQQHNLDPRLLVSLAGAETTFDINETRGDYNAWNWLWNHKHPSQSNFSSYQDGENRVASGLVRLYGLPNKDFSTGYLKKYCSGTDCSNGLTNMQSFMKEQGGNFDSLSYPCSVTK